MSPSSGSENYDYRIEEDHNPRTTSRMAVLYAFLGVCVILILGWQTLQIRSLELRLDQYTTGNDKGAAVAKRLAQFQQEFDSRLSDEQQDTQKKLDALNTEIEELQARVKALEGKRK
jgi:peptidoglycan hydrolase CwlO-like protein